jgi:hypothetical protein
MIRALLAALLSLAPCAQDPGQDLVIHARWQPDPGRTGPPALVWLRTAWLPSLPAWPSGLDPAAAFEVSVFAGGDLVVAPTGPPSGAYLAADVTLSATSLRAICDGDGLEQWQVTRSGPLPPRIATLVSWLRLDVDQRDRVFDLRPLAGLLLGARDEADPIRSLLDQGPAECGEVTLSIGRRGDRLVVTGRSAGGLLFPAVLACVADRRGGAVARDDVGRWSLLAACARDDLRSESARQFIRFSDPRARAALEGLLHTEDLARVVAIDTLLRRADGQALPAVIAAASPAVPGSEEMALLAVWTWLPQAKAEQRAAVLATMRQHGSALVRSSSVELAAEAAAGWPALAPPPAPARSHDLRRPALAALSVLTVALLWFVCRSSPAAASK